MHRCTIHGVETTWSIWLRFSTLLSVGLFFRKHLQGLPAMQNLVGKAMVSRIFPFGHAKKMSLPETLFKVLVLDLCIPEFGGI